MQVVRSDGRTGCLGVTYSSRCRQSKLERVLMQQSLTLCAKSCTPTPRFGKSGAITYVVCSFREMGSGINPHT